MNDRREVRFIELFAGVGGFRLGLEYSSLQNDKKRFSSYLESFKGQRKNLHSFTCVWANEKDKYAAAIYRKNFGSKELVEGDIRTIKTEDIPEADLLVGGFPCQTFSVAGKRKGFKDTRGTLFFEIARVAEAKRPKILLLENVKGLLSAQQGYCFFRILSVLDELGYDVQWQVLNSKYFGVPQNRERVFIIASLRNGCFKQIFPIREICKNITATHETGWNTNALTSGYSQSNARGNYIMNAVRSGGRGSLDRHCWDLIQVGNVDTKGHNSLWGRVYSPKGIAPNLNAKGGGLGEKTGLIAELPEIANCLDKDGYLRTGARPRDEKGKPQLLPIGYRRIRRLIPTECERLQGFPDGWTEGISDTQRYKCLGNAVTVNVIEFLGNLLLNKVFL